LVKSKDVLIGAGIGFLAGLSVAIGGAIKDSPMEGFKPETFIRSPIIGAIVGASINGILPKTNKVIVYLGTIGGERIIVESFKLIRAEIPGKFQNGEWGRQVITEIPLQESNSMQLVALAAQ